MGGARQTMTDGEDWAGWFARHGGAMLLLARQWAGSKSDAEDIVQEAFLRFWRTRDHADDPVAYLYACVRNCAVDWHRGSANRTARERAAARADAVQEWFSGAPERAEREGRIEQVLLDLPQAQREVVVLKIWGRLSFEQVARTLNVSPNTAASRYRYALEKLRRELAEEASHER
jgi:RNA polymerase sigma-70 factor (ECF subfamily)